MPDDLAQFIEAKLDTDELDPSSFFALVNSEQDGAGPGVVPTERGPFFCPTGSHAPGLIWLSAHLRSPVAQGGALRGLEPDLSDGRVLGIYGLPTRLSPNKKMSGIAKSELERLFRQGGNPVHLSATFCLLWVAAVDGVVDDDERRLILQIGGLAGSAADIPKLLLLVGQRDTRSLIAACFVLRQALTKEARLAFLTLAIELSVVDGRLSLSENHFCRFFADLFGISPNALQVLYRTATGAELPEPGDPSSISWWESRTHRQQESRQSGRRNRREDHRGQHDTGASRAQGKRMSTDEAYVVLGLRPGSVPAEITQAYRRAVQAHHPDRFAELGPDAQRAAHEMFLRIKRAYEVLT